MARHKYDMINEIIANFEFERVNEAMKALRWFWAGTKGVPTISELKESAQQRLNDAIEQVLSPNNTEHHEVGWMSNSGGLKATAWKKEDGTLSRIQLEFVVTDWDAEDDENN